MSDRHSPVAASSEPAPTATAAAAAEDSAELRNALLADGGEKQPAAALTRDETKSPTPSAESTATTVPASSDPVAEALTAARRPSPQSDSDESDESEPDLDSAPPPVVPTLPAWLLDAAGVTAAEFAELQPGAFQAYYNVAHTATEQTAWHRREPAFTAQLESEALSLPALESLLRRLQVDDLDNADNPLGQGRDYLEERLQMRVRQLPFVLEHQRTNGGHEPTAEQARELALIAEIMRVLSDDNLTANAELRARHSEGEGGVPIAYLWTQGRLSELASSSDELVAAIRKRGVWRLRDNDTIMLRADADSNNNHYTIDCIIKQAVQDDARAHEGPNAAAAADAAAVWTPLSVIQARVHSSLPAASAAAVLSRVRESLWLVFDPELQCARLSRRDEWPGNGLRVLSESQATLVAMAHAAFDSVHLTAYGTEGEKQSGTALYSHILARSGGASKPALTWEAFSRACALSTTLQVHASTPFFKLNAEQQQKRIESFALLADAGRTPPPVALPNADPNDTSDLMAVPASSDPRVEGLVPARVPSKCPACYFRCTASVADLLVPSSSYSEQQRAEHQYAVLVWSLLPRPVGDSTNQPHRLFNNEKSTTVSNPPPIFIVPQEVAAENAAEALAAPSADGGAAPHPPRASVTSSCSFSIRITRMSPFNRIQLGFRQNSLFGRSHLLQLCMAGTKGVAAPGHGEMRSMRHVHKFRHELFPGDELFQPEEEEASADRLSLTAARQSIAQRSATTLGKLNRLPVPVQLEIEQGLNESLGLSPLVAKNFFGDSKHPLLMQVKNLARSLAQGEIFEQRAEQMLTRETLGAVPLVLAGFKDAIEAATVAMEADKAAKAREDAMSRDDKEGSSSNASSSSSGPIVVSLPPVRLGAVLTVRYDCDRDEIRFSLNGSEIPGAVCTGVLTRHTQPPDMDKACSIDFLHAMIPVMFCSGTDVQVECVAEEEGVAEAHRIAALDALAAAYALAPVSSPPLRDLASAFAREQALLRSSVNSVEHDAHQSYLTPCAASSIPGLLRLFLHDWTIGQALGLPYFSIPIIDCITEYVQYTAPNLGTDKFGWMNFWAPHVRALMPSKSEQKSHAMVSSLFATTFPFKSIINSDRGGRATDLNDVYHDVTAVGEISSEGCFPSGHPVTMTHVGRWARFADKHPDTLRSEDYAQMDRVAAEESRTALDRSVGSGDFDGLDSCAPSDSPARKVLRDEDGQIIYDPHGSSKEPVHTDVHPDEERNQYVLSLSATAAIVPPFSVLTPEELLRPAPSALTASLFDLRVPPAAALDRLQMLRQSIVDEMEAVRAFVPWHLRVTHPADGINGAKDLDTNQAIMSASITAAAPAASAAASSSNPFFQPAPAHSPLHSPLHSLAAPVVASSLGPSTNLASSGAAPVATLADDGTLAATAAPAAADASSVAASLAPAPLSAVGTLALSPIPPAVPSSGPGLGSVVASAGAAAFLAPSASSSYACFRCGLSGHFASACPTLSSFAGGGRGAGFVGAGAPGGPGLGLSFGGSNSSSSSSGLWRGVPAHGFPAAAPAPAGWQPRADSPSRIRSRRDGTDTMHDGDDPSASKARRR